MIIKSWSSLIHISFQFQLKFKSKYEVKIKVVPIWKLKCSSIRKYSITNYVQENNITQITKLSLEIQNSAKTAPFSPFHLIKIQEKSFCLPTFFWQWLILHGNYRAKSHILQKSNCGLSICKTERIKETEKENEKRAKALRMAGPKFKQ